MSRSCRGIGVVLFSVLVLSVAPEASAELLFTSPQYLSGDTAIGSAAGMQVEAAIARGDNQLLAVWSDGRTTPDDYWPFATEGSGTDVYAARIDAAGNVIGSGPFPIIQEFGDQEVPHVAWNGENWLVVWKEETATLPTYETLRAARVAPDGTVLDTTPIVVHDNQSYYDWGGAVVAGGAGGWVVLFQANGPDTGLRAIRVGGDGTVVNPGGATIHNTNFGMNFDIAFAQDEYFIVWHGSFDSPRGRRYTTDLQPMGTTFLPFASKVASDGTDFLVVWASGPPPLATVEGVVVTHAGVAQSPFTMYTAGGQAGTCCVDVAWDGIHYWASWGGLTFCRVSTTGQILDPGGFTVAAAAGSVSRPSFDGIPGGGIQVVYNDGVSGAAYSKDVNTGRVLGRSLDDETTLSTGAPAQLDAAFAEGAGVHVVAYRSRASDSARILAQRIDAIGASLDPEPFEVATGPMPGLGLPSVGAPGVAWNGSVFMITWSDGLEIFARRMLPDGTFLDATPLTVMSGHDPDVAAVGQVFLVVGLDFLNGNPQWQATHSMRVDGATGQNLDAVPNALGGFAIFARHPHVVSWGDRWLAVWQRNLSHDDTIAGTTAAIVNADGTTPGLIDVPLGWRPDVAVSGDRALFVAVTNTIASATTDLAGQIMTADGSFVGTSFLISAAADKQLMPAATWNGSEFVVAWEDKRSSIIYFDERTDVFGARVSIDGTVLDPNGVALANESVPEAKPALAAIGSTTLLAVSTFRPEADLGAYRLGVRLSGNAATAVADLPGAATSGIRLHGAQPNPAHGSTAIRFESGRRTPVSVRIFDSTGRLVRALVDRRTVEANTPTDVRWDGRDDAGRTVGSGVFFYELRASEATARGKVVLLR